MAKTRKTLIVGNWKMNLNLEESCRLAERIEQNLGELKTSEIVICPSLFALATVKPGLRQLKLGAQNAHYQDHGTFTGEVAAAQLRGVAEYVIVGHSERRTNFHETDEIIARKMAACVRNHIAPILCIGENLFERQDGERLRVLHDQLSTALTMLTAEEVAQAVVTYEPPGAISSGDGHGHNTDPQLVATAVAAIRRNIKELYGEKAAAAVRVLYGGSVNADNNKDYLKVDGVDGVLLGGASLHHDEFTSIVKQAEDHG